MRKPNYGGYAGGERPPLPEPSLYMGNGMQWTKYLYLPALRNLEERYEGLIESRKENNENIPRRRT